MSVASHPAARLHDPIAHQKNPNWRYLTKLVVGGIGGAIGGMLGGIAAAALVTGAVALGTFLTGISLGTGAVVAVGLVVVAARVAGSVYGASLGAEAMEPLVDELCPEEYEITGEIITASLDVFINSESTGAARATPDAPIDEVICSKHTPQILIAEGAETVFVNTCVASRVGDKVECGARIESGSPDVFIGDPKARVRDVASEVSTILRVANVLWQLHNLRKAWKCLTAVPRLAKNLPCLFQAGASVGFAVNGILTEVEQVMGNPVHLATGIKVLQPEVDFSLPGPLPLDWHRIYSSADTRDNPLLGQGWSSPLCLQLKIETAQDGERTLKFISYGGREIEFPDLPRAQGWYHEVEQLSLYRTEGDRYFVSAADGMYYLFEEQAHADLTKNALVHDLERIEDRHANYISLRRQPGTGKLEECTDSTGRVLRFNYAPQPGGKLQSIAITKAAPGENVGPLVQYRYDAHGQLQHVIDRTQKISRRFAYNTQRLMSMHAHASGLESYYEWKQFEDRPRVVKNWTNDGETYHFAYRLLQDQWGAQAPGPNDVFGGTEVVDHLGRRYLCTWNPHYELLEAIRPEQQHWKLEYNDRWLVSKYTEPGGNTSLVRYDAKGNVSGVTDPIGRITATGWNDMGLPWLRGLPGGQSYLYTYSDSGDLTSIKAPDGSLTQYVYDDKGLATKIVDAKGGVKYLTWTPRAQLASYTDCSDKTTRFTYDGWGNLSTATDARGAVTRYVHDAQGRLLASTTADGANTNYGYDESGMLQSIADALSRVTGFSFNSRGQLLRTIDKEQREVNFGYDSALRLQRLVNENGESFEFAYDQADRLVQETRVGGVKVDIEYNLTGMPIAVTYHPGLGDDIGSAAGSTGAGATPEVPGWGTTHAGQAAAPGAQPRRIELVRDKVGRLVEKRTAEYIYRYQYDLLDQLVEAVKLKIIDTGPADAISPGSSPQTQPLHTTRIAYNLMGDVVQEDSIDHTTGQCHTLGHQHDLLGNRTQTVLPQLPHQPLYKRALNYLYYGSGHLHQVNYSQQNTAAEDAQSIHQLICDIERDDLHQEILRSQGRAHTRYSHDPVGRLAGAWTQAADTPSQPFGPHDAAAGQWRSALAALQQDPASQVQRPQGLLKAWQYDKVGELRASRHSLQGDTGHQYDATGRILHTQHAPLAGVRQPFAQAANESFGYDPAGNIQDTATQQAVRSSTALSQRGYVRDNLVRVFEDKRYFYDGHGRLIRKLAGRHTDQQFRWDEENHLLEVITTRRPGTEHQATQTTRFDYDAIGRRVAKHDNFGTTAFIWEGMRLIEERRGANTISYVYEPGSYVPLARLDADGEITEQGGLGTQADAALLPLPQAGEGWGEGAGNSTASKTIAPSASSESARAKNYSNSAANDAESRYWASLNETARQKAQALQIQDWGNPASTGTEGLVASAGQAQLCKVYYFHTDQVGMPQELTNAQGQVIWQASYKTWGSTVAEEWEMKTLAGNPVHKLDEGDSPAKADQQQNLRFQGQYLDRDTGLHYNTFRYYDPDVGRFICPDPIGLAGGINLGSYSPNPISWIDPWGWMNCSRNGAFNEAKRDAGIPKGQHPDVVVDPRTGQQGQSRRVPMTDSNGKAILGPDGKPIMTREYEFTKPDGMKIIIQDHGAGHKYPGGVGDQGPHLNVRPIDNPRTGKVPGTQPHYPFEP